MPLFDISVINYMIIGNEVGKETEGPHRQGYVSFKKLRRFNGVKEYLGSETVHLEYARGTDRKSVV